MCFYGIFWSWSEEKLTEVNVSDFLSTCERAQTTIKISNAVYIGSSYGAYGIRDLNYVNRVG